MSEIDPGLGPGQTALRQIERDEPRRLPACNPPKKPVSPQPGDHAMKLLDLLNKLLGYSGKLPELFALIQQIVLIARQIADLFREQIPTAFAFSVEEDEAAQKLATLLSQPMADGGANVQAISDWLPVLQWIVAQINGGGVLAVLLKALIDKVLERLNSDES